MSRRRLPSAPRRVRRTAPRSAVGAGLLVALVAAGCTSSDGATPDDGVASSDGSTVATGDLFDEVDVADQTVDGTTADPESGTVAPITSDDPVADAGTTPSLPADPDPGESSEVPPDDGAPDGSGTDDVLDLFPADEVDDVPFCQAYAEYFQVFIGISFASLGQLDGVDGAATDGDVVAPELLEVFLYPAVVDDVEVIRDTAPSELLDVLDPLFDRVDRAEDALTTAGFTAAEIDEIRDATGDRTPTDVEESFGDDPRIDAAVAAFIDDNGPLSDALDALDSATIDPDADAAADEFFRGTCPQLSTALDQV